MKFSNSTGPLTWSLSEYPKLEQSKAVRQKIHPSLEIFSDWRCTFSFESDHVHFTSPITPKMQNTANVFMSLLMQSVGLSPVCYALWTLRNFPNTNVHVLLHIKHQGKNAISYSVIIKWCDFQKLLGNKANFLSEKLSLSVILGAYNFARYNFISLSLFVADYI